MPGRGHKKCASCGFETGPRAFKCPNCQAPFVIRASSAKPTIKLEKINRRTVKQKKNNLHVNWRELQKGDFIKVVGGGPIWKFSDNRLDSLGYKGKFKVLSLEPTGIHAYPVDKKNSGHCFIYMGEKRKPRDSFGIIKRQHKLRKLTVKPKITNILMSRIEDNANN